MNYQILLRHESITMTRVIVIVIILVIAYSCFQKESWCRKHNDRSIITPSLGAVTTTTVVLSSLSSRILVSKKNLGAVNITTVVLSFHPRWFSRNKFVVRKKLDAVITTTACSVINPCSTISTPRCRCSSRICATILLHHHRHYCTYSYS